MTSTPRERKLRSEVEEIAARFSTASSRLRGVQEIYAEKNLTGYLVFSVRMKAITSARSWATSTMFGMER
jgi:hypothetical protein